jgi:hypothetical protein
MTFVDTMRFITVNSNRTFFHQLDYNSKEKTLLKLGKGFSQMNEGIITIMSEYYV